jgi:hypothetical protein
MVTTRHIVAKCLQLAFGGAAWQVLLQSWGFFVVFLSPPPIPGKFQGSAFYVHILYNSSFTIIISLHYHHITWHTLTALLNELQIYKTKKFWSQCLYKHLCVLYICIRLVHYGWVVSSIQRTVLFWVITQRVVVIFCWSFGTTYKSHPDGSRIILGPDRLSWNVSKKWPLLIA